ncbi:hypothetical protein J0X14_01890 [Muricauda sp. CAU 1633]|uniref:hypothetical protein n=1 Tax=Allomuricauda sp. CAU 1633 TaxID=2816036 RepID=UPI001A8F30EA|nr:hypothetical protein [Muricauda sp. CAU 1633]MBO0321031.1 hypothetical protein [Muricauda sp. CAU 1633]
MRLFGLFLVFLIALLTKGQAQTQLEKGIIHDSIAIAGTSDEFFALYLPTSYSDSLPGSIVFVFDPAARGAIGIQPFIAASEKYGHLLICSNNSRNASYERNFDLANRLFNHIFSQFNIQSDEIYAAGFSGGSRLAGAIASLTNQFAGVLGCGAGFSGVQEHMPTTQNYAYVGLCGYKDMNYSEMLENRIYLNTINFNSTLFTFDGEHNWPPPAQITRAFDWLYLQKLKKEKPNRSDDIRKSYSNQLEWLRILDEEKEPLLLAEEYERMVNDYAGFIPLDSLDQHYRLLQKSKSFKLKKRALETALSTEKKWTDKFRPQFSKDFEGQNKPQFNWWKKELDKLDALTKKGEPELQKMVYRVKFDLYARAFSRKNWLSLTSNQKAIALIDRFLEILYSKTN